MNTIESVPVAPARVFKALSSDDLRRCAPSIFAEHAPGVSHDDLRAGLAGLTGSLVWGSLQPAPPGVPNLRPFQSAHGDAALHWLRDLS